jgi:predicted DCC family thiol-disulfide oxidoreductase YuxK
MLMLMRKEKSSVSSDLGELTVVYDGACPLCRRSVDWLDDRNPVVPLRTISASSTEAISRFGHIPNYGDDMIVATEDGRMWVGPPDAYLVVMWALPGLRLLSYVLSIRLFKPLVGRVFSLVTGNRYAIGSLLDGQCPHCAATARKVS